MNLLVCLSKCPDTTAKIAFTENNTSFSKEGVTFILNPYDEWYSLVRALEIVEAEGGEVTVIHVGSAENESIIRKALAVGATKAVRIDEQDQDAKQVAHLIADYAKDKNYDIIFGGKETLDFNTGAVPSMIAAYLDRQYFGLVNHLTVENGKAHLIREIDGGEEKIASDLPVVLSTTKGIAEQRIPNMRGIMMAKRVPIDIVSESSVTASETKYTSYSLPEKSSECIYIDPNSMDELVKRLHEEAKVI